MRHPISNRARFTPTPDRCGNVQLARDKATLREEIVERLGAGHTSKSRLVIELQTSLKLINEALGVLEFDGAVETFSMLSSRGRLDLYWCLPGQSPFARRPLLAFRAEENLKAMQAHAALIAARGAY